MVLTAVNWVDLADYFYVVKNPGTAVLGRVEFNGFTTTDTKWISYDMQITPVPESSTYGAICMGLLLALYGWRRFSHRSAAARSKSA